MPKVFLTYGVDAEGVPAFMFHKEDDPDFGRQFAENVGGSFARVALDGIDFEAITVLEDGSAIRLYRINDTRGLTTHWWASDIEHAIKQWRDDEDDAAILITKIELVADSNN